MKKQNLAGCSRSNIRSLDVRGRTKFDWQLGSNAGTGCSRSKTIRVRHPRTFFDQSTGCSTSNLVRVRHPRTFFEVSRGCSTSNLLEFGRTSSVFPCQKVLDVGPKFDWMFEQIRDLEHPATCSHPTLHHQTTIKIHFKRKVYS